MIPGMIVALALATAPPAEPAPPPGVAEAAQAQEVLPGPGGWRHALGLGVHSTTFFSQAGDQYTFHSASLGYLGSAGSPGAFLHAFLLLPLQAREDGHVYSTGDYYRRRSGADLLAGPQWRWTVRGAEAEAGPGLHATFIYLPGKQGYRDFSALPLGAGVAGSLRWDTRASSLSRAVTVGTYASVAYDFYDPAHAGDLAHGFTFRLGATVGLGERR